MNEDNFAALSKLEQFASDRGHTILELALGWLLAKPQVDTVIAGATKPEQVKANVAASGWKMTLGEVKEADKITEVFVKV